MFSTMPLFIAAYNITSSGADPLVQCANMIDNYDHFESSAACYVPFSDDGDLADRTLLEVTDGNGLSASSCPILQAGPLYRCVGHEGSVFSVSWTSGGTELVSTSDDRSARIWRLPDRAGEDPG